MGRPKDITAEIEDIIIELISVSSDGLEKICNANSILPNVRTVRRYIVDNEKFRHRYARAKEEQADVLADEIISIADELYEIASSELTNEKINSARLRIDSRKWTSAKLKPKKYGEKIDLTSGGEKLQQIATIEVVHSTKNEN